MEKKRGYRVFFGIILIVLLISSVSAQDEEEKGFFSKIWGKITGFVASLANVGLEIQLDLRGPENFTISVPNQSTGETVLNWSESNAQGYYIWYSDNVTEILQINYSNTNISTFSNLSMSNVTLPGRSNNSWIDTSAGTVDKRFYAVAAYTSEGDTITTSDTKVGKWNITINSESNIKQTFASTPLEENMSVDIVNPPNDFSWIFAVDNANNDTWLWTYSSGGGWSAFGTLDVMEFGQGILFDEFDSVVPFTSAGPIPTGNTTKIIHSEDNIKQTGLAWESISTDGNISELITPPNDFSWIFAVDETKNDTWLWTYSSGGGWSGFSTLDKFEAGKGYLFDEFDSITNFTYERNPY